MKIDLLSDIHLEFADYPIVNRNNADVLVLAGDIGLAYDLHRHPVVDATDNAKLGPRQKNAAVFRSFLKAVSEQYRNVVYVAGNHEFYDGRWHQTLDILLDECANFPNIHFLEDRHVTIDDVVFVGGTLWTNFDQFNAGVMHLAKTQSNDYKKIRDDTRGFTKLSPHIVAARHTRTLNYISKVVKSTTNPVVVVTHTAPSLASLADVFESQHLYASDLNSFILASNPQIKLWCHGHLHNNSDYMVGTTRVVCNPRGYVGYERDTQEIEPFFPVTLEVIKEIS